MAFVRAKVKGGQRYYELVENHRVDGKVRQTMIAYLGSHPTLPIAIAATEEEVARLLREIKRISERAEEAREEAREAREYPEYSRWYEAQALRFEQWAAEDTRQLEKARLRLDRFREVHRRYFD